MDALASIPTLLNCIYVLFVNFAFFKLLFYNIHKCLKTIYFTVFYIACRYLVK